MIALEIAVNGQRICLAGANRVVSAGVSWTYRWGRTVQLDVGGISDEGGADHHVDWTTPPVDIGDEITIRIVETSSPDPAIHRPTANRNE